jgi:hypothetical protein
VASEPEHRETDDPALHPTPSEIREQVEEEVAEVRREALEQEAERVRDAEAAAEKSEGS